MTNVLKDCNVDALAQAREVIDRLEAYLLWAILACDRISQMIDEVVVAPNYLQAGAADTVVAGPEMTIVG